MNVLALDIGGSSVKHALVRLTDVGPHIVEEAEPLELSAPTFDELQSRVFAAVEAHLTSGQSAQAVAISTTGSVDRQGTVINAGHFEGYRNISWGDLLADEFPQAGPVTVVNDGRAAVWAEYTAQGAGAPGFAHFVVGTGVGGGAVSGGRLLFGDHEGAGSLGHIKVTSGETVKCSCSRMGCVETVASGPAIARYAVGTAAGELPGVRELAQAAAKGQAGAVEAFELAGCWLGVAISNVMNMLDPSLITVGGGVLLASQSIDGGDDGGPYLRQAVARARELALRRIAEQTEIRPGKFGNDGGLLGAAALAAAAPRAGA